MTYDIGYQSIIIKWDGLLFSCVNIRYYITKDSMVFIL